MWNDTELKRTLCRSAGTAGSTGRIAPIAVLATLLLLTVTATPSVAQERPAEPPADRAERAEQEGATTAAGSIAPEELRDRIESRYEVLPVRDGVLLRPHEEYRGVRAVEIGGDTIAINAEEVPEEAVRGWLGPRADAVLALAELAPEERRELFGLTAGAGEEAPPEESGEDEAEDGAQEETVAPPAPPAPPEAPERRVRRGSQTAFGGNVRIARDEEVDDVVVFGGSVTVDGVVDGDAVVLGGRLQINGEVENDAVVLGGSMVLGPEAEIGGDVTIVGGSLQRDPGARIGGSIEQVERSWGIPMMPRPHWGSGWGGWSPWHEVGELFWSIGGLVLCALLLAIVLAVGRAGIQNLSRRISLEPFKAGIVGLLIAVLLAPVLMVISVLLVISIVGIPIFVILLLAFIFVGMPALMVIGLVGYTAVSHRVGRWLSGRFGWSLRNPFAEAFVGLVALYALILVGRILGLLGGPVEFFAAMFVLAGWSAQLVAGCVGFGAVFLHLWERRGGGPESAGAMAPPPPVPGGAAGPPATEPGAEAESATSVEGRAEEEPTGDREREPPA